MNVCDGLIREAICHLEMCEAMALAQVGDDVMIPTVNELERLAAQKLGKGASLLVEVYRVNDWNLQQ